MNFYHCRGTDNSNNWLFISAFDRVSSNTLGIHIRFLLHYRLWKLWSIELQYLCCTISRWRYQLIFNSIWRRKETTCAIILHSWPTDNECWNWIHRLYTDAIRLWALWYHITFRYPKLNSVSSVRSVVNRLDNTIKITFRILIIYLNYKNPLDRGHINQSVINNTYVQFIWTKETWLNRIIRRQK